MSNETPRSGQRACLGYGAEQRTFAGVEHAARIKFDDDAKHVVVLQQIGKLLQRWSVQPGKKERCSPDDAKSTANPNVWYRLLRVTRRDGFSIVALI
jgi:hypothetical protein